MSATTARKGTKDGELLQHEDCNVETTVSSSIDVAKAPIVQSNIMTNINKNATKSQVANNNIGPSVSGSNNSAAVGAKGKHGSNYNNKGGAPGYPIHPYRATGPPPPTNTTTTQHGGGKQQKQKGSKNGSGSGAPPMNMHGIPPPRWNGT